MSERHRQPKLVVGMVHTPKVSAYHLDCDDDLPPITADEWKRQHEARLQALETKAAREEPATQRRETDIGRKARETFKRRGRNQGKRKAS